MVNDYFGKDFAALKDKKLFLFDMDGTIYMEGKLFNDVSNLLEKIEQNGGKYVFITNNSSKSVNEYIKKLAKMGISCDENNFYTSTQATCELFNDRFRGKLVYAQGTDSFIKELKQNKIKVTTKLNDEIGAIIVGFDSEITGKKLRTTSEVLTKFDVPYYATNPDWVCPVEFGYIPDCGSMCFGYEKATGKKPIFIGKPNPMMINLAMKKFNANKEQTVVIGDRIYTDIASGFNANVDTILVLSGEATINDCQNSDIKPTYVLESVAEILKCFR